MAADSPARSCRRSVFASFRSYSRLGRSGSGRTSRAIGSMCRGVGLVLDILPPLDTTRVRHVGPKRGCVVTLTCASEGTIPSRGPEALRSAPGENLPAPQVVSHNYRLGSPFKIP